MRAVLMALAQRHRPRGSTMRRLRPPSGAVSGRARLVAGDRVWEVPAGAVVPIPQERHSVETDEDAVILLTVALG